MLLTYTRKRETLFRIVPFIAEFWNTISNLPFILIGFCRLWEGTSLTLLYSLMICMGVCSGIHHAIRSRWLLILDWIPIIITKGVILQHSYWLHISWTSYLLGSIATVVLVIDHVYTPIPVPWGHVFWHVLAAFALDNAYQSIEMEFCKIFYNK